MWIEATGVVVAIAALGVAWKARGDAKRSADEATTARKIARAELLGPHFEAVAYLLDVASQGSEERR